MSTGMASEKRTNKSAAAETSRRETFGALIMDRLVMLAMLLPAFLFVLVLRLIRPWVLVRFGSLGAQRIGHYAPSVELYLSQKDRAIQDPKAVDIFYYGSYGHDPCNPHLKKMIDRVLTVSSLAHPLDWVNRRLPGSNKHIVTMSGADSHHLDQIYGIFDHTPPHIPFTDEEEDQGRASLAELGIPNGASFVCFHNRDSAYLDAAAPLASPNAWQVHDFRDNSVRNYLAAAEELARRGYFAVRLGAVVEEDLVSSNPMILDYPAHGRTDFLDIFLGAKCRFFLGSTAGIWAVPAIFRQPIAWTNYVPLAYVHTWGSRNLFIPKKLWLEEEGRFMTFREILSSPVGSFTKSFLYEDAGITVVENTAEEIAALAAEMDDRLNGTWQSDDQNNELQRRFWEVFSKVGHQGRVRSRIGAAFLQQNRELLE